MTLTSRPRPPASATQRSSATVRRAVLRRWPALLGAALALFIAFDPSRDASGGSGCAPALAASGVIYLGAAALRRPSAAFPLFLGTFVIIGVAQVVGGIDATWVLLAVAVPLFGYGLRPGGAAADHRLPQQAVAMVAFGAAAALALLGDETLGAYLVAAGLLGHAAWDARHHRADRVVVRPFAEMCLVLDVLLAVLIVLATV